MSERNQYLPFLTFSKANLYLANSTSVERTDLWMDVHENIFLNSHANQESANECHFYQKGFALSLVLNVGTRK